MTVLSVSHKCRGSLILSLTDLRQPSTVVIGYQPKNGTNSPTVVAPLYSYFCCFLLAIVPVPVFPFGSMPDSLNVPSNGPWHSTEPAHPKTAGVPTGYGHDLTPFCPSMGTCQRIHTPRGSALEWLQGEGGNLFWGQRHSTVALRPSSANNDTAKPIDISRKLDTAAAAWPQWHSMALPRGHDVLAKRLFLKISHVYCEYCVHLRFFTETFHDSSTEENFHLYIEICM